MKKLLYVILSLLIMQQQLFAADINDWIRGTGVDVVEGGELISDLDDTITNYMQDPLDKLLNEYIHGCTLTITSATVITVSAGEVTCYNSTSTIKRMRRNTSTTTVDFGAAAGVGGIDSGSAEKASTWYDIYAVADANATTFTAIATEQGTAPSDVTYYRYIGSAYNDSGQDLDTYYWFGEGATVICMWDVPVNITTAVSAGAWSAATSCSSGMPSSSTLAIFGIDIGSGAGNHGARCWVRPNGTTWTTNDSNSIGHQSGSDTTEIIAGQRLCITDSSQQIQYQHTANDNSFALDVEGFYLIR